MNYQNKKIRPDIKQSIVYKNTENIITNNQK